MTFELQTQPHPSSLPSSCPGSKDEAEAREAHTQGSNTVPLTEDPKR